MKTFGSLGAFLAHLATLPAAVHEAQKEGLKAGAKVVEREAKEEIGRYQPAAGPFPAWDRLSTATLDGFNHPQAGHIKGKRELGYAPPDNPLLREGHLRESISSGLENDHTAIVGSDDEVALWQEMGTPNALYPIPPRSFLGRAAFVKGDEVAEAVGGRVVWALRGLPRRND
ncbi:conserved protein of unknown function (plasmid) [Rhodovastum atsumiense]|uniref:HK97 gp10 family phage protein n=1 Tax=Rhodovastum atsumiense TaxID=504468 RepID=A0A5M6IN21_9PROT|nr:hypothetical protein [Rhodovastum atsumiense]KAA5609652.1 hypothetical protein F1189_23095 [Rhodovastum atsumiense]CAH2606518.1 conserved protein of unknown function [Rhodovastum atsumiense]